MTRSLTVLALLIIAVAAPAQQAAPTAESRLRDALKKLSVRVSEAEAKGAASQAAEAEAKAKNEELTAKLEKMTKDLATLTKRAAADKDSSDRTIEGLNTKLAARDKQIAQLNDALGRWKDGFNQARDLSVAKENERKLAADKLIVAERNVAEFQRKNAEMYKMGVEVLDRYSKFGLGTALLSREPFVGTMRVKFQTMIQDYGDKLNTARIKPGDSEKKKDDAAAVQAPEKPAQTAAAKP